MHGILTVVFFTLVFLQMPLLSKAQQIYISAELGLGIGSSLDTDARDNDFGTLCDKHLDPGNLFTSKELAGPEPGGCSSETSVWDNSFDGSTGMIAGGALGFSTNFGPRIEAEYFNFGARYDTTSSVTGLGSDVVEKAEQELVRSDERIGRVNISSLFFNVYYDLPTSGKIRPYAGGGVGFGMAEVEFDAVWTRNVDPEALKTADADNAIYNGQGDEAADRADLHKRIAGAATTTNRMLEDTVFGYQVLVGVDYMLSEKTSIGVKGRWVKYGRFSDGDEWDQLRSHASNNGPGTNTVEYTIETDDLSAFGVGLVMKYAF